MQGLELSRRFYFEAVRPILERDFPRFEHAAGAIDAVSDNTGVLTSPRLWRRVAPLYDRR